MTHLFTLLVLFQLKHFLADYPLQAHPFFIGKFRPGWDFVGPLLVHVGIHAVGTQAIATWWYETQGIYSGADIANFALGLGLFDATIHFVMDRAKASPRWLGRWKPLDSKTYGAAREMAKHGERAGIQAMRGNTLFWCSLGFDQMVHHLTHYAVIWFMLVGP